MASEESTKAPLSHRIARVVIKIVIAICLLLSGMILAGTYLGKKGIDERPLQIGNAVSVKNAAWRMGCEF